MDAKLAGSTEVYDDVTVAHSHYLTYTVVGWHWAVVHKFSFGETRPSRPTVERKDLRQQFQVIS